METGNPFQRLVVSACIRLFSLLIELGALTLHQVRGTAPSRLWNEYIARYHYLGYTPMSGSQMRYNVFAGDQLVALLSFGASAWKLAAELPAHCLHLRRLPPWECPSSGCRWRGTTLRSGQECHD